MHQQGRIAARPRPVGGAIGPGMRKLGLGGERDGRLYVPKGYDPATPAPLVVMLHGAGGNARGALQPFAALADEAGVVLLAPESRGRSWDVAEGGYGPDVAFIEAAMDAVFDRVAIDPSRVALEGFSDGASYALSLGVMNGDLFTHLIAFSPGFLAGHSYAGKPPIFLAHGEADPVLSIDRCGRPLARRLTTLGYAVEYREFVGGHFVPPDVAQDALRWFLAPSSDLR